MILIKKYNIKKGNVIEITFLNILGDSTIKQKKIIGTCINLKKNKLMPTISLKVVIIKEIFIITFLMKSPLILKINKL